MATTKPTKPKLVPLKDQALEAIWDAQARLESTTRPYTIRRRLMDNQINRARAEWRDGQYTRAKETAETAGL